MGTLFRFLWRALGVCLIILALFQCYRILTEYRGDWQSEYRSCYGNSPTLGGNPALQPALEHDALIILSQMAHQQAAAYNRGNNRRFLTRALTPGVLPAQAAQAKLPNVSVSGNKFASGPCLYRAMPGKQGSKRFVSMEAICDKDGDGLGEMQQLLIEVQGGIFNEKRLYSHERASFMEYLNFGMDAPAERLKGELGISNLLKFFLSKSETLPRKKPLFLIRKDALVLSKRPDYTIVADDFGAGKKGKIKRTLGAARLNRSLFFDLILTLLSLFIGWKMAFMRGFRRRKDRLHSTEVGL